MLSILQLLVPTVHLTETAFTTFEIEVLFATDS